MSYKYNNTVIQSKGSDHGKIIMNWWKKQGVNTYYYNFSCQGWYYGLIDGVFKSCNYLPEKVKVIELPENPKDLVGMMFRAFKFEEKAKHHWWDERMQEHIGKIVKIRGVDHRGENANVKFPKDNKHYYYPVELIYEHLVFNETSEQNVDTSQQNVKTSPQILDLTNVEGVEMMVSDGKGITKRKVVAKFKNSFIDSNGISWRLAKPILPKYTLKQLQEIVGHEFEIVKKVNNEQ